jgi:hypothetical protein
METPVPTVLPQRHRDTETKAEKLPVPWRAWRLGERLVFSPQDAFLSQRRKGRQGRQKLETGDLKTKLEIRKTENRPDPQMNADNLFRLFCHRGTETQIRLKTIAFFSVPLCLCGKPSAFLGGLGGFTRTHVRCHGRFLRRNFCLPAVFQNVY